MKLNNFLAKFIYNDMRHSGIKGIKFFIRFIVIPFILSPILYPYMLLNKNRYNKYFMSLINNYTSMKEWLNKYEFKEVNNRFVKTDTITENNPMYYDSDLVNRSKITNDINNLLIAQLTLINATSLYNFIKTNVYVSTDYTSELELLNQIYDPKIKADSINELIIAKNVENETELMKYLSLGKRDIKVIFYSISIEYKYIKTIRDLLIYFLIFTCFILTFIVFLTIKY